MDQPLSLGAIAHAKGADLVASRTITPAQIKVLRSIADCRTEAMGGHRDRCDRCHYEHTFWNSCRDRHCLGCGREKTRLVRFTEPDSKSNPDGGDGGSGTFDLLGFTHFWRRSRRGSWVSGKRRRKAG
jgi:hypothetical protein